MMRAFRPTAWISLAALIAGSPGAQAAFSGYGVDWWRGQWLYSGDTLVTRGTSHRNTGSILFQTTTALTPTGRINPFQVGLLARSAGVTIDNAKGASIRSLVTGNPGAFAAGLAVEAAATLNNSGRIEGKVTSTDGEAYGIFAQTGVSTITNGPLGTIAATAPRYAIGAHLHWTEEQTFYNYGMIGAASTGTGSSANTRSNSSSAWGIDSFVYSKVPIYIENNGLISVSARGGKNPLAQGMSVWADFGTATVVNHGILSVRGRGGGKANGIYMGTNAYDTTFRNTGLWVADGDDPKEGGVHAVWMENDSPAKVGTKGAMTFTNSGTIASNNAFAVAIASYTSGPWEKTTFTNTGTLSGGWLGIGWPGDVDFYNSGDIYTALSWIGQDKSNVRAVISGLPTINPVLSASKEGKNTLEFKLAGTLQSVNGKAASGTDLSKFGLGSSGTIVVSGKTYRWERFGTVTGTCIPPAKRAAGPAAVVGKQTSATTAALTWSPVANATSYTVKRAQTTTGPYTTVAADLTDTAYLDAEAYQRLDSHYVVSAVVNKVETADSPEMSLRHEKLTGTVIGTRGSTLNPETGIAKVFDSDQDTFLDTPRPNGGWVGLDLGTGTVPVVTRIAFSPRNRFEDRMVGGLIQGANSSNFSDAVTLHTVARKPLVGMLTAVEIENATRFRYLRYLGPAGGYGNISELQFYAH